MGLKGGYSVPVAGKPAREIHILPEPECLYLPLFSRNLKFNQILTKDGEKVYKGQVLACDEKNYSIPLLCPCSGKVRVHPKKDHIVIEELAFSNKPEIQSESHEKRDRLIRSGTWHTVTDARSGLFADPASDPAALIVSMLRTDSFVADPDLMSEKAGIEKTIQSLTVLHEFLNNCPVYLAFRKKGSPFIRSISKHICNLSWVKSVPVPDRYPFDNPILLSRIIEKKAGTPSTPLLHVRLDDAIDLATALQTAEPTLSRVVALGGSAAANPVHVQAPAGYPVQSLLELCKCSSSACVINGGTFSGYRIDPHDQPGLDIECRGLTMIHDSDRREVLPFANIGFSRNSFSRSFISKIRPFFRENSTIALRGEHRPCVSCGFCEQVCPSGLLPFQLNAFAEKEMLEELVRLKIDHCIECGLCSYVCPSKRKVSQDLALARKKVKEELDGGADL